jgi:hypothetical protein
MSNTLRPLGLGEIIDTAFKIYTRHWRVLMLAVGIVLVPALAASYLVLSSAPAPDLAPYLEEPSFVVDDGLLDEILPFFRATVAAALIQLIGAMLAAAGVMRAVAEVYLGSSPDWRATLVAAGRRLPAILITGVLIVGAIGALTVGIWLLTGLTAMSSGGGRLLVTLAFFISLLVVPWLAVSWSLAIPVLVVENAAPTGALTRSFSLVRGRWWPTFGTILTAWLIVVILSSIASRIVGAFLSSGENVAAALVISTAISAVTTPFIVTVLAVLYFDLRARHEHFDLAGLAGDIGVTPPSPDWSPPREERSDWPPLPPDTDGIEPPPE